MANKQKQMLAVWGNPGGGKTVTAVKLALELSKRKKNVVLVFTDVTAPTLPAVVSEKKLPDVSVGELLAAPGMTQEQVLKTCVPCEKNPYLKMTGIPYAPIYGDIVESRKKNGTPILKTTGVSRSGCMYCMYGVHLEHEPNRFQLMQVTHPQQYDYCINKLGCGAVLDYIGVPYRNQQLEVDHC